MKKVNIKKNIVNIALVTALVASGASIAVESNIDHAHEYCPFCNIIGMRHQSDVINVSGKYDGYKAVYVPEHVETTAYTIDATKRINENGDTVYTAPSGYILEGTNAVRYERIEQAESIEVTDYRNLDDVKTTTIYKRK